MSTRTNAKILKVFREERPQHRRSEVVEEHGRTWVTCPDCGGQWSVNEWQVGGEPAYEFEQITIGDGSCEERAES